LQVIEKSRIDYDPRVVLAMRRSGATLQQIADKIGKTRERVRQILVKNFDSTEHELISTNQLCERLAISRTRLFELYGARVITPKRKWNTNCSWRYLWAKDTVEQVNTYLNTYLRCKWCNRPIPRNRRAFCSNECYAEDHKYKYRSTEANRRQLESIKRYRKRKRALILSAGG